MVRFVSIVSTFSSNGFSAVDRQSFPLLDFQIDTAAEEKFGTIIVGPFLQILETPIGYPLALTNELSSRSI
jgi:hypothetical protein